MTAAQVIFLIVAAITLISAVMVVTLRKMMQSALALILTLLGVAIVFAILGSGFFAVTQVVVYIGAIAILIIFAVMLTQNVMYPDRDQLNQGYILAALAVVLLFSGMVLALSAWTGFQAVPTDINPAVDSITALGLALTDPQGFALPFEAVSVLLLAALVGGIYIARDHHKD
jgi:NADH-quinone oxidoreductase subunit J